MSRCQYVEGRIEAMLPCTSQNSVMTNIKTMPLWYDDMVVGWGDRIFLRPVRTSFEVRGQFGDFSIPSS